MDGMGWDVMDELKEGRRKKEGERNTHVTSIRMRTCVYSGTSRMRRYGWGRTGRHG